MSTCKEITRIIASGELDSSSVGAKFRVRMHVLLCRHCRRYARQLRAIAAAARAHWSRDPDDDDVEALQERIVADLLDERDTPQGK